MITKVLLKNWKSHLNTLLNFSSGTNALVGIMGSGKTSVLDAICFALYGTFPAIQSRKVKLDDIIMKKPILQNKLEVELHFVLNNSNYAIKRVVERGKGTTHAEVTQDGKLIESGSSRVTEFIENLLKTNYDLFSKAIYSEQNSLDYFLVIPKGQRMKKIDELLSLDKFDRVRSNVVSLINKISEKRKMKIELISNFDLDSIKNSLERLNSEIESDKTEKAQLEKNLVKIVEEKIHLEKELSDIMKIKENYEKLIREDRAIKARIEEIRKNIMKIEDLVKEKDKKSLQLAIEKLSTQINEIQQILSEKQKFYSKFQEEIINLKVEIELLEKEKINKLERELEEKTRIKSELESYKSIIGQGIDKALEEKRKILEKINEEFQEFKAKILAEKEILEQIDSFGGKCPICESPLSEKKKALLVKRKRDRIDLFMKNLKELEKSKKINEDEVRKLEEEALRLTKLLTQVEDYAIIKSDLEKSREIVNIKTENLKKLEKEFNKIKDEIEILQNKLKDYSDEKLKRENILLQVGYYEESSRRLEELYIEEELVNKHLREHELLLQNKNLTEKENYFKNLIVKEREIETKIFSLDKIIKEKELRLQDLKRSVEKILKEKFEIKKLEDVEKNLKVFQIALEKTQETLRKEFVACVNFYMNEIWQDLYPYKDFVSIRLAVEEGDYTLQLQERAGSWINVEGIVSGGERSIAALTLRIAFALVLAPNLRWLILDEPTHNLDFKAVEDLAIALRDKIGEYIDQVFLITHDEKLEEAVTGSLYIFKREKEKDGFTQVIKID